MNKLRDTGTDSPYDSTAACSVLHINGKVQYRSGFYSTADAWPAGSCLPACLPAWPRSANWFAVLWSLIGLSIDEPVNSDSLQSIDRLHAIHNVWEKSIFATAVRPFWATKETYWKSTIRSRTSMENTVSDSTTPLLKLDFPLYVLEKIITMRDLFYPCVRISRYYRSMYAALPLYSSCSSAHQLSLIHIWRCRR